MPHKAGKKMMDYTSKERKEIMKEKMPMKKMPKRGK